MAKNKGKTARAMEYVLRKSVSVQDLLNLELTFDEMHFVCNYTDFTYMPKTPLGIRKMKETKSYDEYIKEGKARTAKQPVMDLIYRHY